MMRGATILWAVLAAIAGTGLFLLKYEVQTQEQRLAGLRKDIVDTQESIHVLKAEWSYLNDPERLREMAERHLGLHPLKTSQVASIDSVPMAAPTAIADGNQPAAPAAVAESRSVAPAPVAETRPVAQAAPVSVPASAAAVRPAAQPRPVAKAAKQQPQPQKITPASSRPRYAAAEKSPVAPAAKVASAKSAPKQAATVATKPGQSTYPRVAAKAAEPSYPRAVVPSYPSYPATPVSAPVTSSTAGNVMVITSPALARPEIANSRGRP